jgi:hypothetical protein
MKRRDHELAVPLAKPWRERAKAGGGQGGAAHVGCCVLLLSLLYHIVDKTTYVE